MKKIISFILCAAMLVAATSVLSSASDIVKNVSSGMSVTVKYEGGGRWSKYSIQEATVGAPSVADVDGDGKNEIVFSALSVFCLDAATGEIKWRVNSGHDSSEEYASSGKDHGRASLAPVIADIDGDGKMDIVTAQTNFASKSTCLAVYDGKGRFKSGWPVYTSLPVYAMCVSDLDGDGKTEICCGFGVGSSGKDAITLYSYKGKTLWNAKCGYGLYSNSFNAIDLNGDGKKEIVGLFDEEKVFAFDCKGKAVKVTGDSSGVYNGLPWNGLPLTENIDFEYKCAAYARSHDGKCCSWADSMLGPGRDEKYCLGGTHGGILACDVDGNGSEELVIAGMIVDGSKLMRGNNNSYEGISKYFAPILLNKNRTRYVNSKLGYDWTQFPVDCGAIISMDNKNMPGFPDCSPVCADLNGDGLCEILYTAPDGLMHCFSLDGTEHDGWPFDLNPKRGKSGWVCEYATMPTVADIDGDGQKEVVFGSYTQKDQKSVRGSLYILDCHGNLLVKETLPTMWGSDTDVYYANGCMARPAVADVDGDGAVEIALTTRSTGVVVYEINRTPFKDVPAKSWYTGAVAWCYRKGLISGTSGTTFSPNSPLSRAMFVQILAKADGVDLSKFTYSGTFKDVKSGSWYARAVEWANRNGIASGTSGTTFSPNADVTREQLALFLYKYSELKGKDVSGSADLSAFADAGKVSKWALTAVKWAVAVKLISGVTKTELSPKSGATRAQAAVIIKNYMFNF
ncbi:MAG: S-layer homology domain-containing protein [Clostridia bacterium]|nr:S-layer homology domain-containing protein [Clostridia bacterium]